MLMALMLALLNAAGVAPTPEDMENYKLKFRDRGHHIHMDFGSTRPGGEGREGKAFTWGLGYEYYIDRQFNAVSFEVLGQKLGDLFKGPQDWWVGGGIGWWPVRNLKIFMQAGALFDDLGTATQGRVGVGYRFLFFMLGIMPFVYVQTTDDGRFSWSIGVRIQY
jgi:hypothetical protein